MADTFSPNDVIAFIAKEKDDGCFVVRRSSKSVDWWRYLYPRVLDIVRFMHDHADEDCTDDMYAGMLSYDSDQIIDALNRAYEMCSDDVADAKHPQMETLTAIYRLVYDIA